MENRITAIQANVIATSQYEAQMSDKVNQFLKGTYEKVRTVSEKGLFEVELELELVGDGYLKKIQQVLEEDGFTVKYSTDFNGYCDTVYVSWRNPLTALNRWSESLSLSSVAAGINGKLRSNTA